MSWVKNLLQQPLKFWQGRFRRWDREVLSGLGQPVEVRTEPLGICHLFAHNEDDLFRAQGYITARDRLFQMDMLRRLASGRLAELYGDVPALWLEQTARFRGQGLADSDYFMRLLGLLPSAREGLSWVSPRTYRVLLCFTEGVNEYIHRAKRQRHLPTGHRFLGHDPEEWRPTDSLLVLRLLAFELSFTWRLLLAVGALCQRLQQAPRLLRALLPPELDLSMGEESLQQDLSALLNTSKGAALPSDDEWETTIQEEESDPEDPTNEEEEWVVLESGVGQGSCAWVLSGRYTRSGGPLLCNDPHLFLRSPCAFYQIHLHGGQYNVMGLSIPGTPGVFLGHNEEIAWGVSLSRVDDADIYLEELDPTGERYRSKERYLPLVRREETILVRGEAPKQRWIRSTQRGPLLSDALRGNLPPQRAYSLTWVGQEAVREAEALLQINRSHNWNSFQQALRWARVPALSYVYADRKGNIGGMISGRCPVRAEGPRIFRPLPAAEGLHDWQGEVPFESLPRLFNPESGYVIWSGQRPHQDPETPHHKQIRGIWDPGYRHRRIQGLLEERLHRQTDAEEMARLQRDHYSLWAREFIQGVLRPYAEQKANLNPRVRSALHMLLEWNGHAGPESLAATYFAMFQVKLFEGTYREKLGDDLYRRWIDVATELGSPLETLFREKDAWLEEKRNRMLDRALSEAYKELQSRLGPESSEWQWKRLHRLTLRQTFFWNSGLQNVFLQGPYGTGGDASCINTGSHSWSRPFEHRVGASARHIIDLGQWDNSTWILCGGQSGDPYSLHHTDQLEIWLAGDEIPMSFSPPKIQQFRREWLLSYADEPTTRAARKEN